MNVSKFNAVNGSNGIFVINVCANLQGNNGEVVETFNNFNVGGVVGVISAAFALTIHVVVLMFGTARYSNSSIHHKVKILRGRTRHTDGVARNGNLLAVKCCKGSSLCFVGICDAANNRCAFNRKVVVVAGNVKRTGNGCVLHNVVGKVCVNSCSVKCNGGGLGNRFRTVSRVGGAFAKLHKAAVRSRSTLNGYFRADEGSVKARVIVNKDHTRGVFQQETACINCNNRTFCLISTSFASENRSDGGSANVRGRRRGGVVREAGDPSVLHLRSVVVTNCTVQGNGIANDRLITGDITVLVYAFCIVSTVNVDGVAVCVLNGHITIGGVELLALDNTRYVVLAFSIDVLFHIRTDSKCLCDRDGGTSLRNVECGCDGNFESLGVRNVVKLKVSRQGERRCFGRSSNRHNAAFDGNVVGIIRPGNFNVSVSITVYREFNGLVAVVLRFNGKYVFFKRNLIRIVYFRSVSHNSQTAYVYVIVFGERSYVISANGSERTVSTEANGSRGGLFCVLVLVIFCAACRNVTNNGLVFRAVFELAYRRGIHLNVESPVAVLLVPSFLYADVILLCFVGNFVFFFKIDIEEGVATSYVFNVNFSCGFVFVVVFCNGAEVICTCHITVEVAIYLCLVLPYVEIVLLAFYGFVRNEFGEGGGHFCNRTVEVDGAGFAVGSGNRCRQLIVGVFFKGFGNNDLGGFFASDQFNNVFSYVNRPYNVVLGIPDHNRVGYLVVHATLADFVNVHIVNNIKRCFHVNHFFRFFAEQRIDFVFDCIDYGTDFIFYGIEAISQGIHRTAGKRDQTSASNE